MDPVEPGADSDVQEHLDPPAVLGLETDSGQAPSGEDARDKIERLGRHAWSIVGIGLAAFLVLLVLRRLAWLVTPAVAVIILGVLAAPLVRLLVRRHIPRTPATLGVYVLMLGVLVGFGWLVGPAFVSQVGKLAIDVPDVAERLASRLDRLEDRMSDVSDTAGDAIGRFKASVTERSQELGENLADGIVGLLGSALGVATALLIGLVVSFLVVKDLPRLTAGTNRWLARPENMRVRGAARSMAADVTGYIRGQLLDAVIVGALKTLVLWLLGIPYFIPLGVLNGIANLVPGVGPVVAAVPPVLIAYSLGGWGWALLTLLALAAVQVADYYWFAPTIVGEVHRLPTLVVIVALIIGAGTAGLLGLIIAVPVAMAIRDGLHWAAIPDDQLDAEIERAEGKVRGRGRTERRMRHHSVSESSGGNGP
ncbi:MAG: AI-2E family transporter [Acidimicrobiia bacterium]|nr:AI-2E family transporter [Acidimicrobiia bacterium]